MYEIDIIVSCWLFLTFLKKQMFAGLENMTSFIMSAPLLAAASVNALWFLPPLAAVISLVYNATRFELPSKIFSRSVRLFVEIMIFMSIIMGILFFLSRNL